MWQCFLIIFMRQTLTNDFWGLRKNANCAFPLNINIQGVISTYIRYLVHLKVCLWNYVIRAWCYFTFLVLIVQLFNRHSKTQKYREKNWISWNKFLRWSQFQFVMSGQSGKSKFHENFFSQTFCPPKILPIS